MHQNAVAAHPDTRVEPIEIANLYFELRAVWQRVAQLVIAAVPCGTKKNSFVADKLLMSDHESAAPSSEACFDQYYEILALRGEWSTVSPDIHCVYMQNGKSTRLACQFEKLFPLNGRWRFATHVVGHAVNSAHFIDDTA